MPLHSLPSSRLFRRVVLPALLLLAAGWGLGCYFETNDDPAIILLLRGVTAGVPVTNLHLYFHGLSALLAWLYQTWPALPWYGLLLYGFLYAATVLAFTVLDQLLAGRASPAWITALLTLFFLTAWLEHGLWFNYVRVPFLLAGAGVLFAAQRPTSRRALLLGLVSFGVSWLFRPSIALLGLLVATPGACWLSGRRALPILAAAGLWVVVGAGVLRITRSPQAAAHRALDAPKANLNDYQLYRLTPRTASDSLGLRAMHHWLMADSTLINHAFFESATTFEPAYFLRETAPAKLRVLGTLVLRDYFPLLLLQFVLMGWVLVGPGPGRRWFWLVQAGYAGLVLVLGVVLKLPPRIGLPLFDFWVLSNLVYVLRNSRRAPDWRVASVVAALAVAAGPYAHKTWHRRTVLQAERQHNQQLRQQLTAAVPPTALLVTDALMNTYKSASPFAAPDPHPAKILMLAGWPSADPSQPLWRKQLTGTRDFPESMRRLAQQPAAVRWLLTPGGAYVLQRQLQQPFQSQRPPNRITLRRLPEQKGLTDQADSLGYYQPRVEIVN